MKSAWVWLKSQMSVWSSSAPTSACLRGQCGCGRNQIEKSGPGEKRAERHGRFPCREGAGSAQSRGVRSSAAHLILKIGRARDPCDFERTRMISGVATPRSPVNSGSASAARTCLLLVFFRCSSFSVPVGAVLKIIVVWAADIRRPAVRLPETSAGRGGLGSGMCIRGVPRTSHLRALQRHDVRRGDVVR